MYKLGDFSGFTINLKESKRDNRFDQYYNDNKSNIKQVSFTHQYNLEEHSNSNIQIKKPLTPKNTRTNVSPSPKPDLSNRNVTPSKFDDFQKILLENKQLKQKMYTLEEDLKQFEKLQKSFIEERRQFEEEKKSLQSQIYSLKQSTFESLLDSPIYQNKQNDETNLSFETKSPRNVVHVGQSPTKGMAEQIRKQEMEQASEQEKFYKKEYLIQKHKAFTLESQSTKQEQLIKEQQIQIKNLKQQLEILTNIENQANEYKLQNITLNENNIELKKSLKECKEEIHKNQQDLLNTLSLKNQIETLQKKIDGLEQSLKVEQTHSEYLKKTSQQEKNYFQNEFSKMNETLQQKINENDALRLKLKKPDDYKESILKIGELEGKLDMIQNLIKSKEEETLQWKQKFYMQENELNQRIPISLHEQDILILKTEIQKLSQLIRDKQHEVDVSFAKLKVLEDKFLNQNEFEENINNSSIQRQTLEIKYREVEEWKQKFLKLQQQISKSSSIINANSVQSEYQQFQ